MGRKSIAYIVILLGAVMLSQRLFNWDFNVFKVFIGCLLIFLGYMIIKRDQFNLAGSITIFSKEKGEAENKSGSYATVFAERDLMLNNIDTTDVKIQIITLFGETRVYVPKDLPAIIRSNTIFGETTTPDLNNESFGDLDYKQNTNSIEHSVTIECNTLFGETRFINS